MQGLGAPTLQGAKNPPITLQLASHICGSTFADSTEDHIVPQYAFTEKNPRISGPMQFKLMLFKGQL